MFEQVRERLANTFEFLAARLTVDPRFVEASRISTSGATVAGVYITPDSAVTIAAVWACLRYLSQTVAVLPWHVHKDTSLGSEIQSSHPVDWLLYKRPNPEWSSFQFRETLLHWALRWGNGYAEIERDVLGRPLNLWPIPPWRVRVCRDPETRLLYYDVDNGEFGRVQIPMMDMFHIRGFGEGPVGVNVIDYAAQSLGWARAAQLFGASFFGNGLNLGGVVVNKKALKPAGLTRQKAEFEQLYKGPHRGNKWAHIDNDADVKPFGIEPNKAQFIETQQHLIEEICRWFGVPPHKIMHLLRATFSNIEHQAIEVVIDSVSPWVHRFEDEADYKLFGQNRGSLYTKMNMKALMRGDQNARINFYKGMWQMGAYTPNRILELEDENQIGPDGDIHVMQAQMVPIELIGKLPPTASTPVAEIAAINPTSRRLLGYDNHNRVSEVLINEIGEIPVDVDA